MKLRNLILSLGVAAMLAPASLLAADTAAEPATTKAADTTVSKDNVKATQCERVTGTAIRPSMKNGCKTSAKPDRTYTADELQRTGELDMNQALRKIDPSFH